ncbi:hypothetical protein CLOP_g14388, partial [Closterium sp. NIES-67]
MPSANRRSRRAERRRRPGSALRCLRARICAYCLHGLTPHLRKALEYLLLLLACALLLLLFFMHSTFVHQ